MSTDRIEKEVLLKAPLDRVWRAISDSGEFGRWFGVRFDGPFVAGESVNGEFTLAETDGGVLLRIVESGFDAIPAERRKSAFESNSEGWAHQAEMVRKYLALGESV